MKKLSKEQLKEKAEHVQRLTETSMGIGSAIERFNEVMGEAWGEVETALEDHNAAVESANEFREQVASDAQSYFDERSEKWQESEAGQTYLQWINEWESGLARAECDQPDDVDEPELGVAGQLEEIADEPA